MRTTFAKEIEIVYKPNLSAANLIKIESAYDAVEFLRSIWPDDLEFRERFYAVYLNRQNKILGYFLISVGGISGTFVDAKLVFQPAFAMHASGIILAHNHPSGNLKPSGNDEKLTKNLVTAGKLLDMQVLEHIILTNDSFYSFANNSLI